MKIDVLLGLQWGDEGKGKIVDYLSNKYKVIARFQGGPNAGHSLEFNNIKHVLHTIPSGVFHEETLNLIGNGVVIDPIIFRKEIEELEKIGINPYKNIVISKKAHLIIPSHKALDAASEQAKGKEKIGSTLKGIGPTYMDKTGRNGLRIGDIEQNFTEKYNQLVNKHQNILKQYNFEFNPKKVEKDFFEAIDFLKKFRFVNSEYEINKALNSNLPVLAEGAQGSLLDIDFGTYPFVTSSNTITAGACTGLGIAPQKIGRVFGIFKAYITRVGSGPFTTELFDETGEKLRKLGHEFGATTGRPRRCGWMDLVLLKYVVMINGVTDLIMTKADVLDSFDSIKIATAYKKGNKITNEMPYDINGWEPVYKEFKAWNSKTSDIKNYNDLPSEMKQYIEFIEQETGVKISIISLGPDRKQTISRIN
jgi:adenylosuccinate synthase